jgi:hypothetical protein
MGTPIPSQPFGRRRPPRLRVVPGPAPAEPADFAARAAERAARAARRAERAQFRAEQARLSGTARALPGDTEPDPVAQFPADVRAWIAERFGPPGRCDLKGFERQCWGAMEAHHIRMIGMGGSSGDAAARLAVASNGLWLCAWHHTGWTHAQQGRARLLGLLGSRFGDPAPRPLSLDGGGTWYLLDDEGGFERVPPPPDAA